MTPALTTSPAWVGSELAGSTDWIWPVSAAAIAEWDAALAGLARRGLAWPNFGRDDFPLLTFARELDAVLDELENGRGVVLLRGIPVERYTEHELKNLYWGLGSHLGHIRYQNARGELIGEVRDEIVRYGAVREGPAADAVLGARRAARRARAGRCASTPTAATW